jgi:hypothetical protein
MNMEDMNYDKCIFLTGQLKPIFFRKSDLLYWFLFS